MSAALDAVARALLFEGHLLHPYDTAAPKNRHRWLFGRLYPEALCRRGGAEASAASVECLVLGGDDAEISAELRFLQVSGADPATRDAVARVIDAGAHRLAALCDTPARLRFACPEGLAGAVSLTAAPLREGVSRLHVEVRNETPVPGAPALDDDALPLVLLSTHLVLRVEGGAFISLRDPPPELADLAAACRQQGLWPILFGPDELLCSPIILDDAPRISPESPGDRFDAVEIDELLTLAIRALSDAEKEAMAADPRGREVLARTEALGPEQLARLHGRMRRGAPFAPGSRVRLRPRARADLLDLALAGRAATVAAVEEDLEGRLHVAVTVDDDPGRDLGAHAHRFFFDPAELEPIEPGGAR